MNKMLIISILIGLFLLSCKDEEVRPSVIYVTATVTDKETSLPIDSVEVSLRKNDGFGSWIYIDTYYSNNLGVVNINFNQERNWINDLEFHDENFETYRISLDNEIEKQNYNIKLTKKQQ